MLGLLGQDSAILTAASSFLKAEGTPGDGRPAGDVVFVEVFIEVYIVFMEVEVFRRDSTINMRPQQSGIARFLSTLWGVR